MKKLVCSMIPLLFLIPTTAFAEEAPTISQSTVETNSLSTSSTEETTSTTSQAIQSNDTQKPTSTSTESVDESIISSTILVSQGETLTLEMIKTDASHHGVTFYDLKLLEKANTEKLGKNAVSISYFSAPADEKTRQEIKRKIEDTAVNPKTTYVISFISYDAKTNEVKGRVQSTDDSPVSGVSIFGLDTANSTEGNPLTIQEIYPFATVVTQTDSDGYFTLPNQEDFNLCAFNSELGIYSPVYTLKNQSFYGEETVNSSQEPIKTTTSDTSKRVDKKEDDSKKGTGIFPNTGEQQKVWFSILGIGIILVVVLLIFIKNKKKKV
ncbi:LPXTG cell wall anchor domain-containing protein [Enterococcus sp. LJL99]